MVLVYMVLETKISAASDDHPGIRLLFSDANEMLLGGCVLYVPHVHCRHCRFTLTTNTIFLNVYYIRCIS